MNESPFVAGGVKPFDADQHLSVIFPVQNAYSVIVLPDFSITPPLLWSPMSHREHRPPHVHGTTSSDDCPTVPVFHSTSRFRPDVDDQIVGQAEERAGVLFNI